MLCRKAPYSGGLLSAEGKVANLAAINTSRHFRSKSPPPWKARVAAPALYTTISGKRNICGATQLEKSSKTTAITTTKYTKTTQIIHHAQHNQEYRIYIGDDKLAAAALINSQFPIQQLTRLNTKSTQQDILQFER